MQAFHDFINVINGHLWGWLLIYTLIGVGILFTVSLFGVQIRLLPQSIKLMLCSRNKTTKSLTPFQAFVVGLASRVGVGNIAGVAIAIVAGGPGAVFWMWLTALIGMSSAFAESSLAQLFKIKDEDGHYRGGPAYYIEKGLKQRWLGIVFALSLVMTFAFAFNSVQANSIVAATEIWGWKKELVGVALVIMTAPIIFGGIKRVSRVAEVVVPLMAVLYLLLALYIIGTNIQMIPAVLKSIVLNAFGLDQAVGGVVGGAVAAAMQMGIKRGLFSNEAGMGSAPNAAAAADVPHPVNQGMIQMLGVFVDTIVVCSCTAAIILLSGTHLSSDLAGVQLTQAALISQLGPWGGDFLAVTLFLFSYSSIIGNYAYAESNVQFIKNNNTIMTIFRVLVLIMVYFGSVNKMALVWDMADASMGIMALINLAAITLLAPIVWTLYRDYMSKRKAGQEPVFDISQYPELVNKVGTDVWGKPDA